jgi:hypothetical protein
MCKDKLQNCSCNQFHNISTYKQVETNSMTKSRGGNNGSEKWIAKTLRLTRHISIRLKGVITERADQIQVYNRNSCNPETGIRSSMQAICCHEGRAIGNKETASHAIAASIQGYWKLSHSWQFCIDQRYTRISLVLHFYSKRSYSDSQRVDPLPARRWSDGLHRLLFLFLTFSN